MASAKQVAATVDDVHGDLQALRDDMGLLTKQVARLLSASGHEAVGEAKTRMRQMRDDLGETVSAAGDRSREALSDVSDNIGGALDESLRKHPFTIVALTLGLGFLFGTAWHR
jgi:ElaB/YqjD/DUF883 family membrane-anchored ribosome-binding protein